MLTIQNIHLFAFPINLIIGVIIIFVSWKVNFFSSKLCSLSALGVFTLTSIIIGLCGKKMVDAIITSWPFAAIVVWQLLALAGNVKDRCSKIAREREIIYEDIPFLMMNAGLWTSIFSAYFGSCDNLVSEYGIYQPWSTVTVVGIIIMLVGALFLLPQRKENHKIQKGEEE